MRIFTNRIDIAASSRFYGLHLCLVFLGIIVWQVSQSQLIAFPGAEGAGRFTSGGRGTSTVATTVFEVTNLNDDNNPGSLRYAYRNRQLIVR